MKAQVCVTLKTGILDPQGQAIEEALGRLGFDNVASVRQGKIFDVELTEADPQQAQLILNDMCKKLLANTVIEDYRIIMDS